MKIEITLIGNDTYFMVDPTNGKSVSGSLDTLQSLAAILEKEMADMEKEMAAEYWANAEIEK